MDHGRIVRLLKLMKLLSSNVDYTIQELMERLEISRRSIFRYMDSFKLAGFALEKKGSSVHKLLTMPVKKIPLSKLIHLSEEEAHILHCLLGALAGDSQVMINLEQKLSALFNATSVTDIIGNRFVAENIMRLKEAMDEKKQVTLVGYESGNTMTIADRIVEPIRFSTNYADVYAYEINADKTKTFKVSRIGSVDVSRNDWQHEEQHEIIEPDCFRMTGKEDIQVTFKMTQKAKNLLTEEYPLSSKHLSFDGESWWFKGTVRNLAGVGRFVMGLADQIKVVDSAELTDYLQYFIKLHLTKI